MSSHPSETKFLGSLDIVCIIETRDDFHIEVERTSSSTVQDATLELRDHASRARLRCAEYGRLAFCDESVVTSTVCASCPPSLLGSVGRYLL